MIFITLYDINWILLFFNFKICFFTRFKFCFSIVYLWKHLLHFLLEIFPRFYNASYNMFTSLNVIVRTCIIWYRVCLQTKRMPKATPEASLDSSMEHLIEQDDHLYTKDEVSSNKNLSNLKSTLTFEDSLNVATKMMVKSFEELNNTSSTPGGGGESSFADQQHPRQELVLSAVNLTNK